MPLRNQYLKLYNEGVPIAEIAKRFGKKYNNVRTSIMYKTVSKPRRFTKRVVK